jgi:hypothetical protein
MITTLALTSLMATGTLPAPDWIPAGQPYLLVKHLHAIDNLDKGDMFGKNRADFYAMVDVNGTTYKTNIMAKDDGSPWWKIPMDRRNRISHIHIMLMDDDGGFEGKDDHVDINPRPGRKDLEFKFDRMTGRIFGAVAGHLNETFVSRGGGDDDKGIMTFVITKSMRNYR